MQWKAHAKVNLEQVLVLLEVIPVLRKALGKNTLFPVLQCVRRPR